MRSKLLPTIALLAAAGALLLVSLSGPDEVEVHNVRQELAAARLELKSGRYSNAVTQARKILSYDPDNHAARFVAAEAETKQDNFQQAVTLYDQIESPADTILSQSCAADIQLTLGNLGDAAKRFEAVLRIDSQNAFAHRRLAWILNIQGRRYSAQHHLLSLCRQRSIGRDELLLLGNTKTLVEFGEDVQRLADTVPAAIGIRLCLALKLYQNGEFPDALAMLSKLDAASDDPQLAASIHVLRGRILLDTDDRKGLRQWRKTSVMAAEKHPDWWQIHGQILRSEGNEQAEQVLRRAVAMAPNHQVALYQLASLMSEDGRKSEARPYRDRAIWLNELNDKLAQVYRNRATLKSLLEISKLCQRLGRPWEAIAWQTEARRLVGRSQPPAFAFDGLTRKLYIPESDTPQTIASAQLCASELNADSARLVAEIIGKDIRSQESDGEKDHGITFVDIADDVGLNFQYSVGLAPRHSGRPMYSFAGGGLGVIDFDRDGWPDLYIPQGARWPLSKNRRSLVDALVRNIRGASSQNVAVLAGTQDAALSHGVAVGDYNNDGFPDVYVANIFQNRLYRNLGDGTFEVVNSSFPEVGWTTSCAIADLNADGYPDLYDVNYLKGDGIYDEVCKKEGVQRTCTPMAFDSDPDRFLLNDGNGNFTDRTSSFGLKSTQGNGLGIIVADFNEDSLCDVFVANDADANFLYLAEKRGSDIQFVESAGIAGIAVDGGGRPQACMGTAIADANGDHKLDLFVTNYYLEHNVLYSQEARGFFVDSSSHYGLHSPGYSQLGFGTQFIDANLDTWPDLFVANGHVDDFRHIGAEYEMQPQFFRNADAGRVFREEDSDQLGDYFRKQHLGRGVVSLDWNRDGRPDIAVSHLDHPIALLLNKSNTTNSFLKLTAHGTSRDRDAIGTGLRIKSSRRMIASQIVSSGGYMASNEASIITGLGEDSSSEVPIQAFWLDGEETQFQLTPNKHWAIVEGRDQAYFLPK